MQPFDNALYLAPLPRNWEKALGYTPEVPRRWLLAYWTPGGDEAMYEDGIVSASGNWQPYLDVVQKGPLHTILRALVRAHFEVQWASDILGASEAEATHCFLCDLEAREMYVAPLAEARTFLKPPLPPDYTPPSLEAQAALWEQVQAALAARRAAPTESRQGKRIEVCFHCMGGGGYVLAPDWGYDLCPNCQGNPVRWVPLDSP